MRVVLVDDEQWIVTGLKKILEKRYPEMQILSFTDPLAAADCMTGDMPDLLLTDIRMPQISGMELIARMREAGLRYYAVLTGLNDVQLLQESIRIQVSDYLIKPVNKTELFALIDRVRRELAEQEQQREARLVDQVRLCAQYGAQAADVTLMQRYRTMLLAEADAELPEALLEAFSVQVKLNYFGRSFLLYLSVETREKIAADVPEGCVFCAFAPEELSQQLAALDARQEDELALLAKQLTAGDCPEAVERLHELLQASECALRALVRFCRLAGKTITLWEACSQTADILAGQATPADLVRVLQSLPAMPAPRSADVLTVLAWIEQHYHEEITLSQAAASVFLQANYFTTLFKKEMGVGFIQYLNQYRVEEACRQILHNADASFAQVAQSTGFPSQRHFFATFKKYTGDTPGAFRQRMEEAGVTCC